MEELGRTSVENAGQMARFPVYIVLDDVRSMHNVGSAFRTADAFNAQGIYLCGFTPKPPHRDIHKTALGATETVPWLYCEQTVQAISELKQQGYKIIGIEQVHNSVSLNEVQFATNEKIAIVFGNEVTGVSDATLALCDTCIEIPQWGTKHSLNISVTVGVVLWEIVKKMA